MDDAEILELLDTLEEISGEGEALEESEISLAFSLLAYPTPEIATRAAIFLTGLTDPDIYLRLLTIFPECSTEIQGQLSILLACLDHVEIYVFLLDFIEKSSDALLSLTIEMALANTRYPILGLIFEKLDTAPPHYLRKLERIIRSMDRQRLKTILRLYPVVPHERFLRDILGDAFIHDVYKKK